MRKELEEFRHELKEIIINCITEHEELLNESLQDLHEWGYHLQK